MQIKVFGNLVGLIAQEDIVFRAPIILERLLAVLAKRSALKPEFERQIYDQKLRVLNPDICISINGRVVPGSDLKRLVKENDRIAIFTLLSGG